MSNELLVIGLDGASFNVLDGLIEKGYLPNLARLIAGGSRADLETTFPPITAVAWSSFMTGKNPGKHGIFEFVMRDRGSKRELAVNASFREGRAIWDLLGDAGKRVIVHNFPCTYPPHSVNGLMIADFMTPRGRRDYTFPAGLLAELEERFGPYRLHLSQTYAGGNVEGVLNELNDELEYKARVTEYLMTEYEWDAFFQYFWGTDRIQHELWHVIDESHPRHKKEEARLYRERVYEYFHRVDETVGRLIDLAGPEAQVWVASDHGFGPAHKYCSLNIWLLQQGFLKLKRDALTRLKRAMFSLGLTPETAFKMVKKIPLARLRPSRGVSSQPGASKLLSTAFLSFNDVDWSRTQAFSKGNYGQIYVNLKGREPNGAVEESDYETVCDRIVEGLRALKDPENGGPWVGTIYRREEIYSGPRVADAPDIALLPVDMRYLPLGNADFTSNKFMVDAFGISGCHRMYGVLIARGGPVKRGFNLKNASIYDVAPTMLYLLGREVPDDMDGRVLTEMIEGDFLGANAVRLTTAAGAMKSAEVEFSAEDNADVIERLKSLGYLG
ncbi:MAG TPA: alkaline phosphatase family protein [Blastocatellia bacterium]|nr:alkaline phosphatase family protein [Blastocatellia bacterium]